MLYKSTFYLLTYFIQLSFDALCSQFGNYIIKAVGVRVAMSTFLSDASCLGLGKLSFLLLEYSIEYLIEYSEQHYSCSVVFDALCSQFGNDIIQVVGVRVAVSTHISDASLVVNLVPDDCL